MIRTVPFHSCRFIYFKTSLLLLGIFSCIMASFKLSRSMRKKFINKRYAVVENSLIADEDSNDIIDETPMDIVLNDESEAELSTADHSSVLE